jgi:hypothetical protein
MDIKIYNVCNTAACKKQKQEVAAATFKSRFAIWISEMRGDKRPNISSLGALITRIVSPPLPGQGNSSLSRQGASSMTTSPLLEKQAQSLMVMRVGELIRKQPTSPMLARSSDSKTWQPESNPWKTSSAMETRYSFSSLSKGKLTEGAISFGK